MNIIKKAFLRALANVFLAIGAGVLVTGGINLAHSNSYIASNVAIVVFGFLFLTVYVLIEIGVVAAQVISEKSDSG